MFTRSETTKESLRHSLKVPRLNLTAQIYLAVLTLILAMVTVTAVAWWDAGQQARLRYEREIDDGLDNFKSDFDRATRDLASLGSWLVGQTSLVDLVQSRDTLGLSHYLEPWTEINIADSLTVTDKFGNVLTRVSGGQSLIYGDNILDSPGVTAALNGKKSTGLGQDRAGRLLRYLTLPVFDTANRSSIGVLTIGFYIDGSFLQYRSEKLDQEIAVVYGDRLMIITLTDPQGKPWNGELAPAGVLKSQRDDRSTEFLTIETEIGRHLFKFKPLEPTASPKSGMYGVGVALESIDQERWNLFRTIGIGLCLIAVGTAGGGFFFARALTTPIRKLKDSARTIAQGDLATPIDSAHNDEVGDLARELELMRQQLSKALESTRLEKSRYAAVIQNMGVAAVITDNNLEIVAANPAAEALLRSNQSLLVGEAWSNILLNRKESATASAWSLGETELIGDSTLTIRGRFPLRAQPQVTIEVISTKVEVSGKPAGYVHILHDATAQEHLIRTKDEFIMNAAHELRGPLASLRASIELLVEDHATMSKQDMGVMLRTLQRAVVKFQSLVENIVDVGNIQAGRFRVRPAPTRLDSLIQDALEQVLPLLQGRGQSPKQELACGSLIVSADRARIAQVLINLLTNASKYGPEGEPITLSANSQDGYVVVKVTDCGPGIAPEEQSQLFQRFYRGRRAAEEGIGIGLGLALAREIVQAHGGQMDVESQIGCGTTFWFSLPKANPPSRD